MRLLLGVSAVNVGGFQGQAAGLLLQEHIVPCALGADGGDAGDQLRDRLESDKDVFEVVAVGPVPMMAAVANTPRPYGVHTTVSLNPIMVDGIGMCGACRVTVDGKTKFACVDGPEFDGHEVDFDEALRRQGMYRNQEQRAAAIVAEREAGHVCKIGLDK